MPLAGGIYGDQADNEEMSEKRKYPQHPASFSFQRNFLHRSIRSEEGGRSMGVPGRPFQGPRAPSTRRPPSRRSEGDHPPTKIAREKLSKFEKPARAKLARPEGAWPEGALPDPGLLLGELAQCVMTLLHDRA